MSGYQNSEKNATYYGPIVTGGNRDEFDKKLQTLNTTLHERHRDQLGEARSAEGVDSEWIEVLLGLVNAIALGGCLYVWLA